MDALYFKTNNKEALFEELELPENFSGVHESASNWAIVWLGKLPLETETKVYDEGIGKLPAETEIKVDDEGVEYEIVTEWQDGEFFNIYLKGQNNMDFFTQRLKNAALLREPVTPNMKLL